MTLIRAGVYARQSVVTPLKRACVYRFPFTRLIMPVTGQKDDLS